MPDQFGKLTEEEKKKAIEYISARFQEPMTCPICKDPHWFIGDHVVMPIAIGSGGNVSIGGPAYPQVMMISQKCGYTRFLNAVMMGISLPSMPQAPQPEEKKS